MLSCFDVAKYFATLVESDAGDSISNLKLQKLAYYAQGFHLAMYDTPLFPERIYAWAHGPVVEELYHAYKKFGANPIVHPRRGNEQYRLGEVHPRTPFSFGRSVHGLWAVHSDETPQYVTSGTTMEECHTGCGNHP